MIEQNLTFQAKALFSKCQILFYQVVKKPLLFTMRTISILMVSDLQITIAICNYDVTSTNNSGYSIIMISLLRIMC